MAYAKITLHLPILNYSFDDLDGQQLVEENGEIMWKKMAEDQLEKVAEKGKSNSKIN